MTDFFYSCSDCPEHSFKIKEGPRFMGEIGDYCERKNRFFNKSFPMRNAPCKEILECPECGETMSLYWSRSYSYFACEKHGILQEDGTVKPFDAPKQSNVKEGMQQ